MKTHKHFLAIFIIISAATVCFAQEKTIIFTDGSTLEVTHSLKYGTKLSSKYTLDLQYKEFDADFFTVGKTIPVFLSVGYDKLRKKDKSLVKQIAKIHTSYSLRQDESEFYFATYNSIDYEKFRKCNNEYSCKLRCQAAIISIEDQGETHHIVIIKSIKLLSFKPKDK